MEACQVLPPPPKKKEGGGGRGGKGFSNGEGGAVFEAVITWDT